MSVVRTVAVLTSVLILYGLAVRVHGFTVNIRPHQGLETRIRHPITITSTALSMTPTTKHAPGGGSLLVGNVASNLAKFWVSPKKAKAIKSAVSITVHMHEVVLIAFCGWALLPIVRYLYKLRRPEVDDFRDTNYYTIPKIVGQIAQIGGVLYVVDVLTIVLGVLGFKAPKGFNSSLASTVYLLWGAYRLAKFKRYLLTEKLRKAGIVNKVADVVIAMVTTFGILDILSMQTGMAANSIFALGGAVSLIVSLGSQNLASQIVNGLAIVSTGKFYEGERIVIGDGDKTVSGTVQKMSLLITDIRGSDETVMCVPNQQLAGKRVGNITRCKRSSVKLTVWFSYDDIDKISQVCNDIKDFIKERCPKLDSDHRPFRANLRDFKRNHLEVGIDSFHKIPPYSNEYFENRQQVLYAIADAAKKNGVKFDIPTVTLQTSGDRNVVGKMFDKLGNAENRSLSGS